MLKTDEESVMKVSPGEEGRIIAQSQFDVNEEIDRHRKIFGVQNSEQRSVRFEDADHTISGKCMWVRRCKSALSRLADSELRLLTLPCWAEGGGMESVSNLVIVFAWLSIGVDRN